ncbi:hypothetical protein A2291_08250 [candidate division WOR-1 bacterium RIFOXYB2_FULL_42_35]|uniref:Nucleotidyl transferase AbiEii toxin, Type IV TA system n=1 Tax=candidate division WOR-1 bacterium RIFOXYC2_FULL_41_25 TaxID=1802586 RepID=A0A1F4TLW9_UNCSA|nr:MAG: hypothetical protein A2247_04945 [candidate division WOR-1 bacterium RIFOXYA2_FULL_41_14]OGC23840.1 MAG: hypothetical protein A2291_08250 [candidate division WOR-1 bacterium RIFOXYB2_FULL_42_35]OGC33715.1 MAG: hypothetical protein A2462_00340 [candidate division WOR-1 bacterium RIFOXYC2_FULL_41_25]
MKRKPLVNLSIKELAAIVGSKLKEHGIDAVLTGGAAVTIYSDNRYQSLDLDFVANAVEYQPKEINTAMAELDFELQTEGFFEHVDCPYVVEFIQPPLAVGQEPVKKIVTLKTKRGNFRILSTTDCVKDRLAAYYHWNDLQSLDQALMVARRHKVDLKEIKRWSKVEGHLKKCQKFYTQLETKKQ